MMRIVSFSSLVVIFSTSLFVTRTTHAEDWVPLVSSPDYESVDYWEYDKDSVFVDRETGYVVVILWDNWSDSTTGVAIDCENMHDYFAVLSEEASYDADWRQQEVSVITPNDLIYDFTQEYCPKRESLRAGEIK